MMLEIRQDQYDILLQQNEQAFIETIIDHLREDEPELVDGFPQDTLRAMVSRGLKRARGNGLHTDTQLITFVSLMFVISPNFDQHSAIRKVLDDANRSIDDRWEALFTRSMDNAWEEAGSMEFYDEDEWNIEMKKAMPEIFPEWRDDPAKAKYFFVREAVKINQHVTIQNPHPKATKEHVKEIEDMIGAPLPDAYRGHAMRVHGGHPEPCFFAIRWGNQPWAKACAYGRVHFFYPLYECEVPNLPEHFRKFRSQIPTDTIEIASAGPGESLILLGISGEQCGKVFFWYEVPEPHRETTLKPGYGNVGFIADDFLVFLHGLRQKPIDAAATGSEVRRTPDMFDFEVNMTDTGLVFAQAVRNGFYYSEDAHMPLFWEAKPYVSVFRFFNTVPAEEMHTFVLSRVNRVAGVENFEIKSTVPVTISGLSGFEITAHGTNRATNGKQLVYELFLFDKADYFVVTGTATDAHESNLEAFRRIGRSFKRGPRVGQIIE